MRIDAKAGLMLAATFVLGVTVGAFGAGAVRQRPPRPGPPPPGAQPGGDVADERLPRFVSEMERFLQPRDSAQRAAIRPFLLQSDSVNRASVKSAREAMVATMRAMRVNLAPVLDAAQLQRLDEFIEQQSSDRRPLPGLGGGRGGPEGRGGPQGREGRRGPPPDDGMPHPPPGEGRRGRPPRPDDPFGPPDGPPPMRGRGPGRPGGPRPDGRP